eukprot:scaffold27635_cov20-Tisochrysis_lutea.AAC.3
MSWDSKRANDRQVRIGRQGRKLCSAPHVHDWATQIGMVNARLCACLALWLLVSLAQAHTRCAHVEYLPVLWPFTCDASISLEDKPIKQVVTFRLARVLV